MLLGTMLYGRIKCQSEIQQFSQKARQRIHAEIYRLFRDYVVIQGVLRNDSMVQLLAELLADMVKQDWCRDQCVALFILALNNKSVENSMRDVLMKVLVSYFKSGLCTTHVAHLLATEVLCSPELHRNIYSYITYYVDTNKKE